MVRPILFLAVVICAATAAPAGLTFTNPLSVILNAALTATTKAPPTTTKATTTVAPTTTATTTTAAPTTTTTAAPTTTTTAAPATTAATTTVAPTTAAATTTAATTTAAASTAAPTTAALPSTGDAVLDAQMANIMSMIGQIVTLLPTLDSTASVTIQSPIELLFSAYLSSML